MRTVAQVVGIGLAATLGSVTIAMFQTSTLQDTQDWAPTGLVQLGVDGQICDPSLPAQGPSKKALTRQLRAVTPAVMPCLAPSDDPPRATLHLQITVDCSGALADVTVVEAGDWPAEVVGCATNALSEARFPAHGLTDGYRFDFPVRYTRERSVHYGALTR